MTSEGRSENNYNINETEVGVLKKNTHNGEIFTEFIKIDRVLDNDFEAVLRKVESTNHTAYDIAVYVKDHPKLRALLSNFDYCGILGMAWENGLQNISASFDKQYPRIDEDITTSKEKKKENKQTLLHELQTRLNAYHLELTCKKCEVMLENNEILAFSHRKVGWSNPAYNSFDENFSIEVKTNFGYGASSYFYTLIKYKHINITPYSDWVLYGYARAYEIVTYTSKHPLCNESWIDTMEYLCEAYNLYVRDENAFVQKYIVEECEQMVTGLESFLNGNHFQFLDWQRFHFAQEMEKVKSKKENIEIPDSKFHFLTWRRYFINREFEGRNLIEFRASKISDALTFIQQIISLNKIIEVENYITRIENCCKILSPILRSELVSVAEELKTQNKLLFNIKPKFDIATKKNENFDIQIYKSFNNIQSSGQFNSPIVVTEIMKKMYVEQNQMYAEFCKEYEVISKEYSDLTSKIQSLETFQLRVKNYLETIDTYFANEPLKQS